MVAPVFRAVLALAFIMKFLLVLELEALLSSVTLGGVITDNLGLRKGKKNIIIMAPGSIFGLVFDS